MRARAAGAAACVLAAAAAGCAHAPRLPAADAPPPEPSAEAAAACARMDARAVAAAPPSDLAGAQALYCLRLYTPALAALAGRPLGPAVFDRELQTAMGAADGRAPERLADPATLRWLVFLARRFPEWEGVIEALGPLRRSDVDQPGLADVHDELCELGGLFYYKQGRLKEAAEIFRLVPAASSLYAKVKLLEGAAHVREYAARPAVEAFKEALRAASASADPKAPRLRDLATISLARTFYSTGQFDLARKYYDRLPPASPYRAEATFEVAWTSFMLDDHPRALAAIRALEAEAAGDVKPESRAEALLLEAEIAHADRRFDAAVDAMNRFNAIYPGLFEQVKRLVADSDDDAMFVQATLIRAGRSQLPPDVVRAARVVLSDVSLARRFNRVAELAREMALVETMDPVWRRSAVGEAVAADLALRRSEAEKAAGDLSRRRLNRLKEELAQLIKRTIHIEYEPLQAARGKITPP